MDGAFITSVKSKQGTFAERKCERDKFQFHCIEYYTTKLRLPIVFQMYRTESYRKIIQFILDEISIIYCYNL